MRIVDIITPYHHHQSFSCRHHLPSTHHPTSLVSSTFNNSSMSLQPSTFSTFYPSILHRPSILSFFIDLLSFHPSSTFNLLHPSSTFNLLIPSTSILHRPSTSSFFDLRPSSTFFNFNLQPSSTSRTHIQSRVRWLDVTRFRKMRNAWGLEGFAQQSLAHGSGVTIHLVGVGGQTLFAAGLPT